MANEKQESPDFITTPKKGKVRRLNRLPLAVAGGIVLLFVFGITYTFFERQNMNNRSQVSAGPQPPVASAAVPPVRPSDYVAPPPDATPVDVAQVGPVDLSGARMPADSTATAAPEAMSEAMQNRLRIIQRIEEKKLAQWEAALGADGTVQAFAGRNTSAKPAGQGSGTSPANPLALLAGASMPGAGGGSGLDGFGGLGEGGAGEGGDAGMAASNRQAQKNTFLNTTPDAETYLPRQRKAALLAAQEVKAGTVIPGVMISGLNSDLPGQIIAQVREGVYDSATGQNLLIPAGARLIGTYDSAVTLGQERALVGWQRIIYPDGSSITLDRMPGADVAGYAGFNDKVNNHYWRIFGNGLLLSVFSAGIQLSQPQAVNGQNLDSAQIAAASLGQQMGQLGMQMAQRNMNIQPTLEIRPGYKFNVMVTKDIILPPWSGHPMAQQ